jgi:hypothetical protein
MIAIIFTVFVIALYRVLFPAPGSRRALERQYRNNRLDLRKSRKNWRT